MSGRSGSSALIGDAELAPLIDTPIRSEAQPGVVYLLERVIGRGGFAVACLAMRHGPSAAFPVVLKITRPSVVAQSGEMVGRLFKKEVVALGRLNERVPPTPFVVRLLDTGAVQMPVDASLCEVPWIAVEYVHGGVEGETLQKRVRYSMQHTGLAFDAERAAMVVRQLASGLSEIHAAQVIHRDLKPSNVLCCGFGQSEICKISDFGIARPTGVASTFGKITLGTAGYVAPEQMHMRDEIGPWTDVFSLAGVVFFLLTGQKYFDVPSPVDGVIAASSPDRRSILDCVGLAPELRRREEACRSIDAALARATAPDPRGRYPNAAGFAAALQPWLSQQPRSRPSDRLVSSVMSARSPSAVQRDPARWSWVPRRPPGEDVVIVGVAWESDGHCLAATTTGLRYWDGSAWLELVRAPVSPVHHVRRAGAGRWWLASDGGTLFELAAGEATEALRLPDPSLVISALDGELDDLAVMVGVAPGRPPELLTYCGGHWLKSLRVDFAASIAGLARVDRERWLVVGRKALGGAFAALHFPLSWQLEIVAEPSGPALVTCASQPEAALAIAAGSPGDVVWVTGASVHSARLQGSSSPSASDVDVLAGSWLAGPGRIWFSPAAGEPFRTVWEDARWTAPFVGLQADAGTVVAVTVDGGVIEGRAASEDPTRA